MRVYESSLMKNLCFYKWNILDYFDKNQESLVFSKLFFMQIGNKIYILDSLSFLHTYVSSDDSRLKASFILVVRFHSFPPL